MTFISDYVRRVILVVLLVRVALMLAPDGEMRSYVRFVCGLLVLTAIMSPLVHLVPAIEEGAGELPEILTADASTGDGRLLAEAAWESTEHLTASLYGERLAEMMATEINALAAVRAADAWCRVKAEVAAAGDVQRVEVFLMGAQRAEGQPRSAIRVSLISIGGEASPEEDASDREVPPGLRDEIVSHLTVRYSLKDEQVVVMWGEGDGR